MQRSSYGYRRSLYQREARDARRTFLGVEPAPAPPPAAADASFGLTRRDVDDLRSTSLRDSYRYIQARRDQGPRMGHLDRVKSGLEVGAGAALVGILTGRLGTSMIPGTPIPMGLAAYALGTAAAVFAPVGRFSDDIQNVANGALAGFVTAWGVGLGTKMREKSGAPVGPVTSGSPDARDLRLEGPRMPMPQGYGQHTGVRTAGAPTNAPVGSPAHLTEAELVAIARRSAGR